MRIWIQQSIWKLQQIQNYYLKNQQQQNYSPKNWIYNGRLKLGEQLIWHKQSWYVQRPSPEPLDLKSSVEELFTMRTPTGQNVIDEAEKENGANRGAEDSGVVKGKVVDVGSAYLTRGSSAMNVDGGEQMNSRDNGDRGFQTRQLRQFVSLKPPPLMAAIFPWDRGREHADDGLQWRPEVSAEDTANATEVGGVGKNGDGGATQWLAKQGLLLSSFRDVEKAGKGFLLTTKVAANPCHQASASQCSPEPAVVKLAEEWWKHEVDDNLFLSAERELL
ncbi:hypothetical protein PIB30_048743 [Stylosanthes scabra]|uniref:Uncharacterized protein n=1 Tax=Stylosanthes scabra TaxID=79078 RepID=A0ABU6ZFV1_9FABA|nr:hypothetical protein [Stylosanthes scabra]